MNNPMPKDNEVDEKVVAFAVVVDGEPDYTNVHKWACESEAGVYGDGPIVTIEPLTYAATVAELRADRDSWREHAEDRLLEWDKACQRADAAEQRVADLESALRPLADATFAEFCSKKTERMEPDDSKVSYPEETCHITFGMIRNARKALTGADPT